MTDAEPAPNVKAQIQVQYERNAYVIALTSFQLLVFFVNRRCLV
jgi:hypothetical protein